MKRIALIEDDPTVREELALLLENEGYQVLGVTDFAAVPRQVQAFGADLVLLDLGLPGKDGFALCAALRRESPVPIIIVTSRDAALDELKALSLGGQTVELTRNELKILACLLAHPGQIVARADLIEALWDSEIYIDDNTLSVNVTRLRAKLGQLGLGEAIKTRRGMGYQYDGTGLSR